MTKTPNKLEVAIKYRGSLDRKIGIYSGDHTPTDGDLISLARGLLFSGDSKNAEKIYRDKLRSEFPTSLAIDATERHIEEYFFGNNKALNSGLDCFRTAIKYLKPDDLDLLHKIRNILENLKGAGVNESVLSGFEIWIEKKSDPNYKSNRDTDWINKWENGQLVGETEHIETAKRLLLLGRFGDAQEICREAETDLPSAAYLDAIDSLKNDGTIIISDYFWRAIRNLESGDRETEERIRQAINYQKSRFSEIGWLGNLAEMEECERRLDVVADHNYNPDEDNNWFERWRHDQLKTEDDYRSAARQLLLKGYFSEAVDIYDSHMDGDIFTEDVLDAAENMETADEARIKCYSIVIDYIDPLDFETIERIRNGLISLRDERGEIDIEDWNAKLDSWSYVIGAGLEPSEKDKIQKKFDGLKIDSTHNFNGDIDSLEKRLEDK